MLEHERPRAKNSIAKNARKFKREKIMPEFENREDKSASENATALKHTFKSKMKSMKTKSGKTKHCVASIPGF